MSEQYELPFATKVLNSELDAEIRKVGSPPRSQGFTTSLTAGAAAG
jgi:hypothetical protein